MKEIKVSQELLNEIVSIQWLSNCGKPIEIDLVCSVEQVDGWEKAEEYDEKDEWEDVISNSRNQLSEFIMRKLGYSVREFNSTVIAVRESPEYKTAIANLIDVIEDRQVKEEFGGTLSWLLLNAGIERTFAEFKGCPQFFSELLEVFKLGHCPCGWSGRWPKGTLFIY
ncbi:hypothetical protein MHI12_25200 [Paenibacillus sp. FSL H8-0280]|uniref:hypothetical protein n=1 Tax=Paenibacillus TaxID=44249 RepID=UPI00119C99EF|nr:hypothetical protein [Paenibacillus xylanexedens]